MRRRPHALLIGCLALALALSGSGVSGAGAEGTGTEGASPNTCPSRGTKTLSGTVQGEDGRYLFAMIGLDLYDSRGTPINGTSPYDCYIWINLDGASGYGSPTSKGGRLTKNWSAAVPTNTAYAYVELYVRSTPNRQESWVRYGKAKRERTPIGPTGRVFHLKAPLNCGVRGDNRAYGDNGYMTGRVFNNGKPWGRPAGANIYTWSQHADSDSFILGWSIGTWRSDGTYVLPSLAPKQEYVTRVILADGRMSQWTNTYVRPCMPTYRDLEWGGNRRSNFTGGTWYLANTLSGNVDRSPSYGATPGDLPIAGDWNGDGRDTIGIRRGRSFLLRNDNSPGSPNYQRAFGPIGGTPIAGDWDGDGVDSVGLWHDGIFALRKRLGGDTTIQFRYGRQGDQPVVGDWDGDGIDTIGVRRGTQFLLRNFNTAGKPNYSFRFGSGGTLPVAGDWNHDGTDTIGTFAPGGQWHVRNRNSAGKPDRSFNLGKVRGDIPVTGDWNDNKSSSPGVFRSGLFG